RAVGVAQRGLGVMQVHPLQAAVAMQTLCNMIKASQRGKVSWSKDCRGEKDGLVGGKEDRRGVQTVPWPASLLYGCTRDTVRNSGVEEVDVMMEGEEGDREGNRSWGDCVGVLDGQMLGGICELLQRLNPQVFTTEWWETGRPRDIMTSVRTLYNLPDQKRSQTTGDFGDGWPPLMEQELGFAMSELELSGVSLLREMSRHPDTVGLLMNRSCVGTLLLLAWFGRSVETMEMSAEAVENIWAAYHSHRGLKTREGFSQEAAKPWVPLPVTDDTWEVAGADAGEAKPLGSSDADRAFMQETEKLDPFDAYPVSISLETEIAATGATLAALAGQIWGGIREYLARLVPATAANVNPLAALQGGSSVW
ncbi:unnamed protein product, partial [Discosporangium mesarthrocarpum]